MPEGIDVPPDVPPGLRDGGFEAMHFLHPHALPIELAQNGTTIRSAEIERKHVIGTHRGCVDRETVAWNGNEA